MLEMLFFAPVTQRAWILPTYFDHLRSLEGLSRRNAGLIFLYGEPSSEPEDGTRKILEQEAEDGGWGYFQILTDDQEEHVSKRRWNMARYEAMARMRNRLLDEVRDKRPNVAFSLDTDMLLPPDAILPLLDDMVDLDYDGIAPLTYMTPSGPAFPNAMDLQGTKRIAVQDETIQVPACFGAVMMGMDLYQVDYAPHLQGEDLGWANNVHAAGLRLAICPRVKAKHVMMPEMLDQVDKRVGF